MIETLSPFTFSAISCLIAARLSSLLIRMCLVKLWFRTFGSSRRLYIASTPKTLGGRYQYPFEGVVF